jgi:hypothetical protein
MDTRGTVRAESSFRRSTEFKGLLDNLILAYFG